VKQTAAEFADKAVKIQEARAGTRSPTESNFGNSVVSKEGAAAPSGPLFSLTGAANFYKPVCC
jgi:hypothetical protein